MVGENRFCGSWGILVTHGRDVVGARCAEICMAVKEAGVNMNEVNKLSPLSKI
jgi:hypothetical protein